MTESYHAFHMETLIVKVPDGTKAKLRQVSGNLSELIRGQIEVLLERRNSGSVHQRAKRFCGIMKGGPGNAAISKEYLKQYGQKRAA